MATGFLPPLELPGLTGPSGDSQRVAYPLTRGFDVWTCCIHVHICCIDVHTPSALPPTPSDTRGADRLNLTMAGSFLGYFSSGFFNAGVSPPFTLVTFCGLPHLLVLS